MKKFRYLFLCLFLLATLHSQAQVSKLSPFVRRAIAQEQQSVKKAKQIGQQHSSPSIMTFVKSTDMNILKNEDCRIYAQWDDIYIASIPLDKVHSLAKQKEIIRIEAGKPCDIQLDTTSVILRSRELWSKPYQGVEGITGKGIVVGVMDIGFDLTHPTFLSQDGSRLRVQQLWDMLDFSEGGEAVMNKEKDTVYVGRQYIGEAALLALQHTADGLHNTHGTHTSAIAAGSGWNGSRITPYIGMAPDADLCLVSNFTGNNKDIVPEENYMLYTTATDMLGFKYIFDYAESVGKPCVINFSEGAHEDLYESGLYNEVLNKMLGPGRILCVAAGNEGYKLSYLHKPIGKEQAGSFLSSYSENALYVMRSNEPVKFKLTFYDRFSDEKMEWTYDAEGLRDYPDSVMIDTLSFKETRFSVLLNTYPSCFDESLFATDFLITNNNGETINDNSEIIISLTLLGEDNDIEAFNASGFFANNSKDSSLGDAEYGHNILFPGTADEVITVGATSYVDRHINYYGKEKISKMTTDGSRVTYSSTGPTLSGNIKPDVMAPGHCIISAYSSFYLENHPGASDIDWDVEHFDYNGRTYPWNSNSGTSMSCPAVAGIIAQWLQVCPTLTPSQIKDVFANTCTHHDESLDYPNIEFGYGEIDAQAGVEYIKSKYTGIVDIKNTQLSGTKYYTIDGIEIPSIEGRHGLFIIKDEKGSRVILGIPR